METRSGTGATAQASFWALAFMIISLGIGLVRDAGDDQNQMLIGLGIMIVGFAIIWAKYFIKLPDVSEQEMQDTLMILSTTYEGLVRQAAKIYNEDVHAFRDEIVKHRALIMATAALLPAKYQVILNNILDNMDNKYSVPK